MLHVTYLKALSLRALMSNVMRVQEFKLRFAALLAQCYTLHAEAQVASYCGLGAFVVPTAQQVHRNAPTHTWADPQRPAFGRKYSHACNIRTAPGRTGAIVSKDTAMALIAARRLPPMMLLLTAFSST